MDTRFQRRKNLWYGVSFFLILLMWCFPRTPGAGNQSGSLRGPAFSDPLQVQDMGQKWEATPIKYDASAGNADIVITLDQQMYPALLPVIQEYGRKKNLNIFINKGTCGLSAGMLSKKQIDIGGYCCTPDVTDRLPGLAFNTLGIAALAIIVHPENPVDNITLDEARKIFSGEIYRWSELKGSKGMNTPIRPVGRLHCKLRPGHWRLLLDNEDLFSPKLIEVGAIPDMISRVSRNISSIGYETLWMVRYFHAKGKVKVLKIDGYNPTDPSHLISGRYSLYRTYNITLWKGKNIENRRAKELVEYLLHETDKFNGKYALISASKLRKAGWKFYGNELIGEKE